MRSAIAPAAAPQRPSPRPPLPRLSYSALGEYHRCGYRFYVERVLGIPPVSVAPVGSGTAPAIAATERGVIIHALLEELDFRRPRPPAAADVLEHSPVALEDGQVQEMIALIAGFASSELCARLGRATGVRREERFSFLLEGEVVVTGALDVLAREPGGRLLVVDYKSDRLGVAAPAALLEGEYVHQRLIYALAALRAGAAEVEVAHVFLEQPDNPATARFAAADAPALEAKLAGLVRGVLEQHYVVAEDPHRSLCAGCPAEGGLCSWPIELTRREAPDRLF